MNLFTSFYHKISLQKLLPALLLLAGSSLVQAQNAQQPSGDTAKVWLPAKAITGEGAIFHPGRGTLLWVDIEGKTLYETAVSKPINLHQWSFNEMVSTVVPESDSTVIVALQRSLSRLNLNTNTCSPLVILDDRDGKLRCNDGKCDPQGRLWVGTMAFAGTPGAGALYCYDGDRLTPRITDVSISNGLVWNADQTLFYYIDTRTNKVARYRYTPQSGTLQPDGIAVQIPQQMGSPDGMCIDRAGNLWIAQWGGFGVYCWDPRTGKLLRKISVPCPNVTSCAFGGENRDILFITTAAGEPGSKVQQQYPLSGSLFFCKPGVEGVETSFFSKKN